jgi:hypothetical protein
MYQYYLKQNPNFYYFPIPNVILGIEFANERDALFFKFCIEKYCPKFENDSS